MQPTSNTPKKYFFKTVLISLLIAWAMVAAGFGPAFGAVSKVATRLELDRKVLPAGGPQTAVLKVSLDAPPPRKTDNRPAVNLCLVLDRSGSMKGSKLKKAKEAAIEAIRRLGRNDIFSVVFYDHQVNTVVPAQAAGGFDRIADRIRNVQSGGRTALFAGVSQGAAEIRKNIEGSYVHRIILLSDGLANVGPSAPSDLGRLGAALIKENISVTTIGVGTDYNEDLMTRLSQGSDGNTYFVESSRDLPRIFTAELGDVLSVVARKVHLTIQCEEGIRPIKIIGREGRIQGTRVTLSFNQLYGSQAKYALIEVSLPAGSDGQTMAVASAQVIYENPYSQATEQTSGQLETRFSSDVAEVKKGANVAVQKDVQLNMHAIAQEEAIEFSDKGKTEAAVQALTESARKLKSYATTYGDKELEQKAVKVEQQAAKIKKQGMSSRSRKSLRTDSYQIKNQQKQK
jgi:Ca-activated chloride channel homolog